MSLSKANYMSHKTLIQNAIINVFRELRVYDAEVDTKARKMKYK